MTQQFDDIEVSPRARKTLSDVMTVEMSIKCGKSSKSHKLHMNRSHKDDRTKSKDSKNKSKLVRTRELSV
jgi:hypothetical protein